MSVSSSKGMPLLGIKLTSRNSNDGRGPQKLKSPHLIAEIMADKVKNSLSLAKKLPKRLAAVFEGAEDDSSRLMMIKDFEAKIIRVEKLICQIEQVVAELEGGLALNSQAAGKIKQQRRLTQDSQATKAKKPKHTASAQKTSKKDYADVSHKEFPKQRLEPKLVAKDSSKPPEDNLSSSTEPTANDPDNLLRRANHHYHRRNWREASQAFKRLHEMRALPADQLFNYGIALYRAADFDQGARVFEQIYNGIRPIDSAGEQQIKFITHQKQTLTYWIRCLKQLQPHSLKLLSLIQKSISLYEDETYLDQDEKRCLAQQYQDLALIQQKQREPLEVIVQNYERANHWCWSIEATVSLASIYFRSKKFEQAIEKYRMVIQRKEHLSEPIPDAWRENLIQSLFNLNLYQQAKHQFLHLGRPSAPMLELQIRIEDFFGDDAEVDLLKSKLRERQRELRSC